MNELLFAEWAQLVIPMHCWCGRRCGARALLTTQSLKRADMRRAPWIWSSDWRSPICSHLISCCISSAPCAVSNQVPWPFDLFQNDFQCAIVSLVTMFGEGCQSLGLATFFGATSLNIVDLTVVSLSNWSNPVTLLIKFNQWGLRATRFDFQSGQKQSTRSWLPW